MIPPSLISDPQSCYLLNEIGMYKNQDSIPDNPHRVMNGGLFYNEVSGSKQLGHNESPSKPIQVPVGSCQI